MHVKVIASIRVKPGDENSFVEAACACVVASRLEPGVLRYDLWRQNDDQRSFVFDELYTSEAAMLAHAGSEHVAAFAQAALALAQGPPSITVLESLEDLGRHSARDPTPHRRV